MPGKLIRNKTGPSEGARADAVPAHEDTVLRLLADVKAGRVDPRTLSPDQRRSLLVLLACGTQTSAELATLFGVSPSLIRKDLGRIREEFGREVRDWTLEEVLGQLYMAKEKCAAHAMKVEDPGLAWTVERDFVKTLKELGVLGEQDRSQEGFRVVIERIGDGYERAGRLLANALDPELVGAVLQGEVVRRDGEPASPPLPLDRRLVGGDEGTPTCEDEGEADAA